MLHLLLSVSILSVMPWDLMINEQQEQMSYFEGENEKEKESEMKGKEKEKRKKNEKKDSKFLLSVRIVTVVLQGYSLRSNSSKFVWESPILAVVSPPPEEMLG